MGKVINAERAQVAKVEDVKVVRAHGGGGPRAINGMEDLRRGKRGEGVG